MGVPVTTHVFDKVSPAGSVGFDSHETTVPPVFVGVKAAMAAFNVYSKGLPAKLMFGRRSLTVMFRMLDTDPPEFVAVIV